MADLSAKTSGFASKSRGSGGGAVAATAFWCEAYVYAGRGGRATGFSGGVIGL